MDKETENVNKKICTGEDHTRVVANHYNSIEEKGLDSRFQSPIFYMRNFNNWVKGIVISDYLNKVKQESSGEGRATVLDICCGKGGDLFKWKIGNIKHVVCIDIASVSVSDCQERYELLKKKAGYRDLFSGEFLVADCTKDVISEQFKDPNISFDLVNCQFAFHYSFETLKQAEQMMMNVGSNLKEGGYFIGTIPDAYDIIRRIKKAGGKSVGNDVFNIELQFDVEKGYPLFGAKYNFHLKGVVDCPEFLVHFPTFIELAKKYNLELVMKERFEDYFVKNKEHGRSLLQKMICFQSFPLRSDLQNSSATEFEHAQRFIDENTGDNRNIQTVGTISKSEWEAASIYLVFAFQKRTMKSHAGE